VLAYRRSLDGDHRAVVVNFTGDACAVDVEGAWTVEVASDGAGEGEPYRGRVAGDQALVLRPGS